MKNLNFLLILLIFFSSTKIIYHHTEISILDMFATLKADSIEDDNVLGLVLKNRDHGTTLRIAVGDTIKINSRGNPNRRMRYNRLNPSYIFKSYNSDTQVLTLTNLINSKLKRSFFGPGSMKEKDKKIPVDYLKSVSLFRGYDMKWPKIAGNVIAGEIMFLGVICSNFYNGSYNTGRVTKPAAGIACMGLGIGSGLLARKMIRNKSKKNYPIFIEIPLQGEDTWEIVEEVQ